MNLTAPKNRMLVGASAAIVTLIVVVTAGWITLPDAVAGDPGSALLADESPCVYDVDKWSTPTRVLLGEVVNVTLTVRTLCPGEMAPLHVVIVLDESASMDGDPRHVQRDAATQLVKGLDLENYSYTLVGVAAFNTRARTLSQLSNNERRVVGAINRAGASGDAHMDAGLLEGLRVLRSGRGTKRDITEVLVLFSDGQNDTSEATLLQASRQVRGQGALLITVCVSQDCDQDLMRRIASSPRYHFAAARISDLIAIFTQIRDRVLPLLEVEAAVKEIVSPKMRIVSGSGSPEPSARGPDWLQWTAGPPMPKEGVTFSFAVEPLSPGYFPISAGSTGVLTDTRRRTKSWDFPASWVTVLQPGTMPTPDWTPTTSPTLTPTVVPSPTHTPTPRPRPVYLPYQQRERDEP